jgi:hypothetical protein
MNAEDKRLYLDGYFVSEEFHSHHIDSNEKMNNMTGLKRTENNLYRI